MSYCPNCGERIKEIENFCPFCRFKFDDRLKPNNKELIIKRLENRVAFLEDQLSRTKQNQILELKNELEMVKQELIVGNIKIVKKKNQSGDLWYLFCVIFVIVLFIWYLISLYFKIFYVH
ncbi:MAG: zinc-ribbon domain-containing protein [Candidatus Lokiarchaeota archaeon]|nr:zinc-ribbon domain-containing protein [Candidatus Lokiarchaeota archaeon]